MTNNREKLIAKVRALLSKTVENGCTEAEAMAALSMAQAMMDAYEVTEEDIKLEGESAVIGIADSKDAHKIKWKLAHYISKFTDTFVYGNHKKVKFAGLLSDTEFAVWLAETLAEYIRSQLKSYMWANKYTSLEPANKRIVINGFVIGCCHRINMRLKELSDNRKISSNSKALVIAKQALIDNLLKDVKIGKPENRGRKVQMYAKSYADGQAAGDRASFGRPVEGQAKVLRIGK